VSRCGGWRGDIAHHQFLSAARLDPLTPDL
jgi:hypothetical protein